MAGKRGVAERLAADLVGIPYLTRPDVAARYGLSGQGAINAINSLVGLGMLEDADFHQRGARVYWAPEVVRIVSS
jgi:hypothetical protein